MSDEVLAVPVSEPARAARRMLVEALRALQTGAGTRGAHPALDHVAAASSALFIVETEPGSSDAAQGGIRTAADHLGGALRALDAEPRLDFAPIAEMLARALALLYPVVRGQQRQRRAVVMRARDTPPPPEPIGVFPPAPVTGRVSTPPPFTGQNQRGRGTRVMLEVDIGVASDSHFYTGLSQDLSSGGVFIATYAAKSPGTEVSLYFALPGGRVVQAVGVVRWTRSATDDSPPGMGVSFTHLSSADVAAIEQYCAERPPLYHESADPV